MLTMIGKRLMFGIPSLIGVVIVTFLLTRALPGDPAAYFAGPAATKEAVEQIRKKLGLDKPLIEQFFRLPEVGDGMFGQVLPLAQRGLFQTVADDDVVAVLGAQARDDVGADEARAARHHDHPTRHQSAFIFSIVRVVE